MSGMFTLAQALHWIPGGKLVGDSAQAVTRVHSDTRTLQPGDLFVALKGERFDAHDFLAQAKAQGAVAAIAHHGLALAVPPAAGGGHGQQRQDHRHADDRGYLARLAAAGHAGHPRQFQQ